MYVAEDHSENFNASLSTTVRNLSSVTVE